MLCYITTDSWLLVMCSDWCRSHISCVRHCSLSYRCSHYRLQTLQVMFSLTHLYHSSIVITVSINRRLVCRSAAVWDCSQTGIEQTVTILLCYKHAHLLLL